MWTLVPVDFCFLRVRLDVESHQGQIAKGGQRRQLVCLEINCRQVVRIDHW